MKKGELTVREFKMWVAGIEEMQEKGWTPNASQWNKIKAKIALLAEDVPEYSVPVEQPVWQQPSQPVQHYEQPAWTQPPVPMMSSLDIPTMPKHDIAYMDNGPYQTPFL